MAAAGQTKTIDMDQVLLDPGSVLLREELLVRDVYQGGRKSGFPTLGI
jgi:hypothetical protein